MSPCGQVWPESDAPALAFKVLGLQAGPPCPANVRNLQRQEAVVIL